MKSHIIAEPPFISATRIVDYFVPIESREWNNPSVMFAFTFFYQLFENYVGLHSWSAGCTCRGNNIHYQRRYTWVWIYS